MPDEVAFIPFKDHERTAAVLSDADLKTTLEVSFRTLRGLKYYREELPQYPKNPPDPGVEIVGEIVDEVHRAVTMWLGQSCAFSRYVDEMVAESFRRGLAETNAPFFRQMDHLLVWARKTGPLTGNPWWWGQREVHHNHRYLLCHRDWDHYGPRFPMVFDNEVSADIKPYFPVLRLGPQRADEWAVTAQKVPHKAPWPPKDVPLWMGNPVKDVEYDTHSGLLVLTSVGQDGTEHSQTFDPAVTKDTLGFDVNQVEEVRRDLLGLWDAYYRNAMAIALDQKRQEELKKKKKKKKKNYGL